MKRCETCGSHFTYKEGEEWKKTCLPCWKKSKRKEDNIVSELTAQLIEARRQLYEAKRAAVQIEPEMVRRLLQLCHPDKHGNSEASQKATHWLMGRKR